MSRGKGVPFKRAQLGAGHSTAGSADRWFSCSPRYGRSQLWTRALFVRPLVSTHRRGDPRGLSDEVQSIPRAARAVLHGCNSGGDEALPEGEDPQEGKLGEFVF